MVKVIVKTLIESIVEVSASCVGLLVGLGCFQYFLVRKPKDTH